MKRLLMLLLTSVLLCSCGCQSESLELPSSSSNSIDPSVPVDTIPCNTECSGYYVPDSILEKSTHGAVKIYPLNLDNS